MLESEIINILISYRNNSTYVDEFLSFIRKNSFDFWDKKNFNGHITVSAWILSKDNLKALLIHHKKLNKWYQIGGHIEKNDTTILQSIKREIYEETGLRDVEFENNALFHIAKYSIPKRNNVPKHTHFDLIFKGKCDHKSPLKINNGELIDAKWFDLEKIKNITHDKVISFLISKSLRK